MKQLYYTVLLLFINSTFNYLYSQVSLKEKIEYKKICIDSVQNGNIAPNLRCKNNQDEAVSLYDYKNKYILIDVWATWCGSCLEQMPFFEKLKEELKEMNIVFLSISIDDDINDWKNYLKNNELKGIQLWNGRNNTGINYYTWFINEQGYCASSIPTYILIGKDKRIINKNCPFPVNGDLKYYILSLIKQDLNK